MEKASIAQLGLWGTSFTLNILALTLPGFLGTIASLWIEHMLSNFNLAVVAFVVYEFWQADVGIWKVLGYVIQGAIMYTIERFQGIGAIKFLRPSYPYLNS